MTLVPVPPRRVAISYHRRALIPRSFGEQTGSPEQWWVPRGITGRDSSLERGDETLQWGEVEVTCRGASGAVHSKASTQKHAPR